MKKYATWTEPNISEICRKVRCQLDMSKEVSDDQVYDCIDQIVLAESRQYPMNLGQKTRLREQVFNSLRKLDVLQELLDDTGITEIMINGHDRIFIEKDGIVTLTDKCFESKERYEDIIQQIVSRSHRRVNRTFPIVDVRLEDGSRANIILEPIALNGSTMTIRKFRDKGWDVGRLVEMGTMDESMAELFRILVHSRYNIIVSGGTGSGKTTLLNLLSAFIPKDERIITIEDSAELDLRNISNLVRLETRNANVEGEHSIEIKDLIRASMRLRPDRLIVGEVRGEEAFFMINGAMNTGHDGSLSTCHANSCQDAISRLETMILMGCEMPLGAIRGQIGSAIDIIIQLGRLRDKSRKILEVTEVIDAKDGTVILNPLLLFQEAGEKEGKICGSWIPVNKLKNRTKLQLAGCEEALCNLEEKRWI